MINYEIMKEALNIYSRRYNCDLQGQVLEFYTYKEEFANRLVECIFDAIKKQNME